MMTSQGAGRSIPDLQPGCVALVRSCQGVHGSLPKCGRIPDQPLNCSLVGVFYLQNTVLVKSFAHLNGIFFLASLEEIGELWKWWTVYSGVLQLTDKTDK